MTWHISNGSFQTKGEGSIQLKFFEYSDSNKSGNSESFSESDEISDSDEFGDSDEFSEKKTFSEQQHNTRRKENASPGVTAVGWQNPSKAVIAKGPNKKIRVLLDSGSDGTFCSMKREQLNNFPT